MKTSKQKYKEEITKFEYKEPKDVPKCKLYTTWADYGEEFDCSYDVIWGCEECLCNWDIGGYKDPRTPEKYENSVEDEYVDEE